MSNQNHQKSGSTEPYKYMNEEVPSYLHEEFSIEFKKYTGETRVSGIFYSLSVLKMIHDTVIADNSKKDI